MISSIYNILLSHSIIKLKHSKRIKKFCIILNNYFFSFIKNTIINEGISFDKKITIYKFKLFLYIINLVLEK